MNNRIMITTADIGLAHIYRALAVAKRLEQDGYEIHLCLSRRNCKIAKENGFHNLYPVQGMSWVENEYGVDAIRSAANILLPTRDKDSVIREFISQYRSIRDYMLRINPKLLVSDGCIPTLRVSKRWKRDSVFITNVIRPRYPWYLQIPTKIPQYLAEQYMKASLEIMFADLPPGKAISLYNLGNPSSFNNLRFVGSFIDMRRPSGIKDEKFIYVMSSGTPKNRERFFRKISPLLDQYCRRSGYTWKMSLGLPLGLMEKTELHEVYGYVDSETKERFQRECSLILHNGSHLICFEAISKEKPSLIVPTKHQLEQEANAKRMQELDLAVCLEEKDLETKLSQAIGIMDERKDSFSAKLQEFREYAERLDGVETTVKDIKRFV